MLPMRPELLKGHLDTLLLAVLEPGVALGPLAALAIAASCIRSGCGIFVLHRAFVLRRSG